MFTLKSMYVDLLDDDTKYLKTYIWKMKVPLKIEVFMWFLHRKVILTTDNLIKRNWNGQESCCFCDNMESIQHLLFDYLFAKIIWHIIHITFVLGIGSRVFLIRRSYSDSSRCWCDYLGNLEHQK
jgi:hypothetical protein